MNEQKKVAKPVCISTHFNTGWRFALLDVIMVLLGK
jgi:hypothetical protein